MVIPGRLTVLVLAAAAAAVAVAGCGANTVREDKAGGSAARPVTLRLGVEGETAGDDTDRFVTDVRARSRGKLRIRVVNQAAGPGGEVGSKELRLAHMVRSGTLDAATLSARAWDLAGVTSLQALQAPFLITRQALFYRVITGPMADEMLAGLRKIGVTGLVLLPQALIHPLGLGRVLVAPRDFVGARIHTGLSKVNYLVLRALGAKPFENKNWDAFVM